MLPGREYYPSVLERLKAYLINVAAHTLEEGYDVRRRRRQDQGSLIEPKTNPEVV